LESGSDRDGMISRRSVLGLLGLGAAAAFLTGCETGGAKGRDLLTDLPDAPYLPPMNALIPDHTQYAPPTPPTYIKPAIPLPVPTNTYGIIPRSVWAKAGPDMKRVDPMGGVALITFHHSGDPKVFTSTDFSETAQHLEWVREYHRSRNFQDIGYHFAIDRAGRVWQLRSLRYQGQHVRYNNEHNIGVVVLGNFEMQAPSAAQKDKMRSFGSVLRKQYSLPISRVKTHREIVTTECPGANMQSYMVQVRKQGLI